MLAPQVARAERAEAERLFIEARKSIVAGRCDEASDLLRKSLQEEPSVGALLNLGACEESAGDLVGALRTFQRAEQLARRTDAERTEEAVRRQVAIEARIGSIRVRAPDDATLLEVNGLRVMPGERVLLPPGTYDLVARSRGRRASTKVTVAPGKHDVPVDAPPFALSADEPVPSPAPLASSRPSSTPAWATIVVGGVALGVASVSGLMAISGRRELDRMCPAYPACPPARLLEARDEESTARTAATLSTVSAIGALTLVAAGVTWLLLLPRSSGGKLQPAYGSFASRPVDSLR